MRLQILELPYDPEHNATPFVLVASEVPAQYVDRVKEILDPKTRDEIGATGVIVGSMEIEIGPKVV